MLVAHRLQELTHSHDGAVCHLGFGIFACYDIHYIDKQHVCGIGRGFFDWHKCLGYHSGEIEHFLILLVALHNASIISVAEPIALSPIEFSLQLGIYLFVVQFSAIVDGVGIYTDKASRACWVGQWMEVVSGSDE